MKAGVEALLPEVARRGRAELGDEQAGEILGGDAGGGGKVGDADGLVEARPGGVQRGDDGGMEPRGCGESTSEAGLLDVEVESADGERKEGITGRGRVEGLQGKGYVEDGGVEAAGGDGEGMRTGRGVEGVELLGRQGVRDSADPGLDAGLAADGAAVSQVARGQQDGLPGRQVKLGLATDGEEGFAGVDAEHLVGGVEG